MLGKPRRPVNDLRGKRFDFLVVAERWHPTGFAASDRTFRTSWECFCDCGRRAIVTTSNLVSRNTKSCGQTECNLLRERRKSTST